MLIQHEAGKKGRLQQQEDGTVQALAARQAPRSQQQGKSRKYYNCGKNRPHCKKMLSAVTRTTTTTRDMKWPAAIRKRKSLL